MAGSKAENIGTRIGVPLPGNVIHDAEVFDPFTAGSATDTPVEPEPASPTPVQVMEPRGDSPTPPDRAVVVDISSGAEETAPEQEQSARESLQSPKRNRTQSLTNRRRKGHAAEKIQDIPQTPKRRHSVVSTYLLSDVEDDLRRAYMTFTMGLTVKQSRQYKLCHFIEYLIIESLDSIEHDKDMIYKIDDLYRRHRQESDDSD